MQSLLIPKRKLQEFSLLVIYLMREKLEFSFVIRHFISQLGQQKKLLTPFVPDWPHFSKTNCIISYFLYDSIQF